MKEEHGELITYRATSDAIKIKGDSSMILDYAENTSYMFSGCESLQTFDLPRSRAQ